MTTFGQADAFVRHRWAGDIPTQMLQLLAVVRSGPHPSVQGKTVDLCHVRVAASRQRGQGLQREGFLARITTDGNPIGDRVATQAHAIWIAHQLQITALLVL